MNAPTPILVAGIGNIFFGDDAFGCEVVRELMRERRPWPEHVRIEDFGIRGHDLAYAIMDGVDAVLIDAVPRSMPPGSLYLIQPDLESLGPGVPDAHNMSLVNVLRMVESLGGQTGRLYLIGCEPAVLEREDGHIGLSPAVAAVLPRAIDLVERVVADLIYGRNPVRLTEPLRPAPAALKEVS
jgi:hydrogenase maturation protease